MIRKVKDEFVVECNECGAEYPGGCHEDFRAFVAEIRAEGWVVKKDGDKWQHFCPDCADDNRGGNP